MDGVCICGAYVEVPSSLRGFERAGRRLRLLQGLREGRMKMSVGGWGYHIWDMWVCVITVSKFEAQGRKDS